MKQAEPTNWSTIVWAAVLDTDLIPPKIAENMTAAARTDPQALKAMIACGSVFVEQLDLERFFTWLDRRGFARPPIDRHILVSAQLEREVRKYARRESTRPAAPAAPPAPPPRGPARERIDQPQQ